MNINEDIRLEKQIILQDIKENGYEEAKKKYIRRKKKEGWICVGIAIFAFLIANFLHFPPYAIELGTLCMVFLLIPYVLIKGNYDKDFDRLYGEFKNTRKEGSK